jgi:hypothetical protein
MKNFRNFTPKNIFSQFYDKQHPKSTKMHLKDETTQLQSIPTEPTIKNSIKQTNYWVETITKTDTTQHDDQSSIYGSTYSNHKYRSFLSNICCLPGALRGFRNLKWSQFNKNGLSLNNFKFITKMTPIMSVKPSKQI